MIKPDSVTISGFSSGACFAHQLHTAFSASIIGMGTFAGAPYLSMFSSNMTDEEIVLETLRLAEEGLIDPVENMREDSVLIFQGILDTIVPWYQGARIKKFYDAFLPEENINLKDDIDSEHGFPSDTVGGPCPALNSPYYVNNCNYSGAFQTLEKTLGGILTSNTLVRDFTLNDFDQNEFFDENNANDFGLGDKGFIYVPDRCKDGDGQVECQLHVHFHGCGMGRFWISDNYVQKSGFLPLADTNDIVMMFPQIRPSWDWPWNPDGCWDCWGYLGETEASDMFQYATKYGWQMRGVARMVERVANIQML